MYKLLCQSYLVLSKKKRSRTGSHGRGRGEWVSDYSNLCEVFVPPVDAGNKSSQFKREKRNRWSLEGGEGRNVKRSGQKGETKSLR